LGLVEEVEEEESEEELHDIMQKAEIRKAMNNERLNIK
jgi:hypothetical protein